MMMSKNAFRDFIHQYEKLTDAEWEMVANRLHPLHLKKGDILLKEGQICNHIWFLEQGFLRFFIWKDGEAISKFFTLAPYTFTSQRSFNLRQPTKENIEVLEDSIIWEIGFDDNQKLMQIPSYNTFVRKLIQEVQHFTEQIMESLQNKTAEERYRVILEKNPKFMQRVSLKHLASFLGITPQSLSRIRKNIH